MKLLYVGLLLVSLALLGCINFGGTEATCSECELELHKAQLDQNALQDRYDGKVADLKECQSDLAECKGAAPPACPVCEACPEVESCDAVEAALSACNSDKSSLTNSLGTCNTQLSACLSGETSCSDSLAACNSEKAACEADLTAALESVPTTLVRHYVYGNLGVVGDYRTTTIDWLGVNYSKVIIGLDYTGGTDTFFSASVTTDYGLNRIRWYTLTSADGGTWFTADIDDGTVLIDQGNRLKINSAEYNAGTSKEGLALRRVIMILVSN